MSRVPPTPLLPHYQVTAINYARLWKDIGNLGGTTTYEYDSNMGTFRGAMGFVNQYLIALERVCCYGVCFRRVFSCCGQHTQHLTPSVPNGQERGGAFSQPGRNQLTLEVVTLARYMIYFGFYDLLKLVELVKRLYVWEGFSVLCAVTAHATGLATDVHARGFHRLKVLDATLEGAHETSRPSTRTCERWITPPPSPPFFLFGD